MSVGTLGGSRTASGRDRSERLRTYLASDETVAYVGPGTLRDDVDRMVGTVGVTDDRVVFVSDGVGFVGVAHGSVASVKSRVRTTLTRSGLTARLGVVGGLLLTAAGLAGVALATTGPVAVVVTFLAVGAVGALECVRRYDLDVDRSGLAEAVETRSPRPLFRRQDGRYTHGSNRGHMMVGFGVVAVLALAVLASVAAGPSVALLALVTIVGVAATVRTYRSVRDLDRRERSHRREREVRIHLVDGRVVRLRVDVGEDLDRALSTVTG